MKTGINRTNHALWLTLLLSLPVVLHTGSGHAARQLPQPAPEFTHQDDDAWLNSKPLSLVELRGKVVLLDFWTFDCWNCYRSFPWLRALESRMKNRAFMIVGVHTPEFDHERQKIRLEEKVKSYRLRHPIMIDNDFSYWNAVGSRYWPSFFIIDKSGVIRADFIGQTDLNSAQAEKIERIVERLLAE